MPDQAPMVVTCSVWVPSTGAGGIFPDGQLAAVHSSVIVVPGLLFQTYHPVAAEAPPSPVPGKDAGTDNPSSKLGLFRIPAGTVDGTIVVGSLALAPADAPPDTLTWLVNCEAALDATFTVTVIGGRQAPAASASLRVQVFPPLGQLHPVQVAVPLANARGSTIDTSARPTGTVSGTVPG